MMPTVEVRPYRDGDETALVGILEGAVETLAARDYDRAQRMAWLSRTPSPKALAVLYGDGRSAFVAELDDGPVGFCDITAEGHIRFLFVAPCAARRGVARALLNTLDATARANGLVRIHSEASETALPVFLACGFKHVRRRDFEIAGVAIHHHLVEKLVGAGVN